MRYILISILLLGTFFASAQLQQIRGKVIASDDVEGIHILNKSSVKYTVTDTDGSFEIFVKLQDTLTISSLKYETREIVVDENILLKSYVEIELNEKITELDEVYIGSPLTGDLNSDLNKLDAKAELNFYDLGIPGYVGKPKTISERKLADADGGGWGALSGGANGGGVGLNMHKLLNLVSGRTKKLKERVRLEFKNACMLNFKSEYSEMLFKNSELSEDQKNEYFYFCLDDERFSDICNSVDFRDVLEFLKSKLSEYNDNINPNKN